jgi:hypothetical protein
MDEAQRKDFLRGILVDEITKTLGLKSGSFFSPVVRALTRRPVNRLTELALDVDKELKEGSFNSAFAMLLKLFSDPPLVSGADLVPEKGPLLLIANHPGTVDTPALLSTVPRPDTKIISGYTPFTDSLDNLPNHLIYSTRDSFQRMSVVRESIRHMKDGGCLLLYPAGAIEPDPAITAGAIDYTQFWHRSVEIFVKRVPGIVVSPIVVSHVLLERFYNHPIARIRKNPRDRQRAAEMLQIVAQIINRDKHALTPRITFGKGFTLEELQRKGEDDSLFESVKQISTDLMHDHVGRFEEDHPPLIATDKSLIVAPPE